MIAAFAMARSERAPGVRADGGVSAAGGEEHARDRIMDFMNPRTSLRQEVTWFVVSLAILVWFVPTAVSTMTAPSAWTAGFLDLPSWQAELPTWSTFGINVLLILVAAVLAFFTVALLVRRMRAPRETDSDGPTDLGVT